MTPTVTRLLMLPLCAAIIAGTALHQLSLPAHAETTTTTTLTLPNQVIPRSKKDQENYERYLCEHRNELPQDTQRPDLKTCQRYADEALKQQSLERERAISEGHPVAPAQPAQPTRPVQ